MDFGGTELPVVSDETVTLASIADDNGLFSIVAMDQRNTLKKMYTELGLTADEAEMRQLKADVVAALSPHASGFLLDPTIGIPAIEKSDTLSGDCGLLVAADPEKRETYKGEPRTLYDEDKNAEWVKSLGGKALKFLVRMNPGRKFASGEPDLSQETLDVVQLIIDDCRKAGVPSVIENLVYKLPDDTEFTPEAKAEAIIRSAELLNALQPSMLKLEYPGSPARCQELASILTVPWAVLSAGVPFDEFTTVLKVSCDEGGAAGFIAGRAVWRESISLKGQEREKFLREVAVPRLNTCVASIQGKAQPWHS